MWQRMAVSMACVWGSLTVHAQEPVSWTAPPLCTSLLSQDSRLRFEVISGQISVRSVHWQTKRRETLQSEDNDTTQSLSYLLGDRFLSLRYEAESATSRFVLEVPHCMDLSMEWTVTQEGTRTRVAYVQIDQGVRLTVETPEGRQEFRHDSLWHLLFEQPEMSRTYLLPMLQLCRESWAVEEQWDAIRSELFTRADTLSLPTRGELQAWVSQLSSPRRQDRCAAMRRLQQVGQPLIAFLDTLETDQLDREQRFYLKRLRTQLDRPVLDTPAAVAARLVADPRIWTALTLDADVQTRALAAQQLARLTGHPAAAEDYASSK